MNKIFITFTVLILALCVFFLIRSQKTPKMKELASERKVAEKQAHWKQLDEKELDLDSKRNLVYAGSLHVPPPCPKDTHLGEEGYCRKGASKDVTDHIFVGGTMIMIDESC